MTRWDAPPNLIWLFVADIVWATENALSCSLRHTFWAVSLACLQVNLCDVESAYKRDLPDAPVGAASSLKVKSPQTGNVNTGNKTYNNAGHANLTLSDSDCTIFVVQDGAYTVNVPDPGSTNIGCRFKFVVSTTDANKSSKKKKYITLACVFVSWGL